MQCHLEHEHRDLEESRPNSGQPIKPTIHVQPTIMSQLSSGIQSRKLTAAKQAEIDDALIQLFAKKVLPFSLVDHPMFRKFCGLLDSRYQVPHRKKLVKELEKKKVEMTQKMSEEIASCQDVAITHDGWTSLNTESYGTVTGHFVTKDWELRSVVLETKKVEGSHTAESIGGSLLATKAAWNLPVPIVVTDNAANERKAFELLQWTRFGCYGHRINLIVKNALQVSEISRILGKGRKLVTFFHQSSSMTDLLLAKQRLLMDNRVGHKLIQDVPTRWNSSLAMLRRILEQTPSIMAIVSDPSSSVSKTQLTSLRNYVFNFDEQLIVDRLVSVLAPFEKATTLLCADKTPSMHKVMPVVMKLHQCIQVQDDDAPMIIKVKEVMSAELSRRSEDKSIVLMASILNPFTKGLEFISASDKALAQALLLEEVTKLTPTTAIVKQEPAVQQELAAAVDAEPPSVPALPALPTLPVKAEDLVHGPVDPSLDSEAVGEDQPPPDKKPYLELDDWLEDVICIGQSRQLDAEIAQQEVSRYLNSSQTDSNLTILDWWKKNQHYYPRISILARRYMSIPASSVPSERVFSLAGSIVSKKRSRMNSENVDLIIFLNKNMDNYW